MAARSLARGPRTPRMAVQGRYLFFILASLGVLMASIDSTIVAVGIPQLSQAFDAPLTWVSWTLTAYQLVQVAMFPVAGKLSDTLGRRRVFLAYVAIFTVGSLLCALSPSIGFLIFFRVIQALGGGGLMPSAVGIITDQFTERRAQAIGLFTSVFPIGGIVGPNLGAFILEHWSWRELFIINVPIGVLVLVGVYRLLPETVGERPKLRVDFPGIGLFTGSIAALTYGMTALGDDPSRLTSPLLWALFAVAVALFAFFVRHIKRAPDPVVEYELLAKNPFLAANLYNLLFGAVAFGFFSFIPYYVVVRFGMSTIESGAVLAPRALAMMLVSTVSSLYIIRLGYRLPMLGGMAIIAASLVLVGQDWAGFQRGGFGIPAFWIVAIIITISGIGTGFAGPASNNAALDLAPRKSAAITGLRGMFRQTGGVIGIGSIVLALSFFPDKAEGLAIIFQALAGLLLVTMFVALLIPDTARERYLREQRLAQAGAGSRLLDEPAAHPDAAAPLAASARPPVAPNGSPAPSDAPAAAPDGQDAPLGGALPQDAEASRRRR